MLDLTGYLRRIMNASAVETFDPATDSLEAIRDFIAAMIGFGPGVSLWMFGRCAAGMAASTTIITTDNLGAALPNDVFNGEFYIAVIHNANAPGVAPEGEWRRVSDFVGATQTFTTDAFSVNVEENDLLLIVHESILFGQPLARGTLDFSSATVPADSTRTEGNNYFRGHLFMTTEGAARFQPKLIVEYTGVGGIFTLDPNNPLTVVPGLVDYVVLPYQTQFVPAADAAINRTPADVIGNKTDTAIFAADGVSSIIRYLKGIIATAVGKLNIQEVVIYPVAEDADVTELANDGMSPPFYPAVANSTNANAEGAPGVAWSEDINFEQEGTITIISIHVDFEWQTRFLVGAGAGTQSSSKIQISRDAGATWVDVTDNFNNVNNVMTNRRRQGVGRWIPTIVAGANQLMLRAVHWTNDAGAVSTSEMQIRSNSRIRIAYRKS